MCPWKYEIRSEDNTKLISLIPVKGRREAYSVYQNNKLMMTFDDYGYALDYALKLSKQ
jgi:hypothetical protein